MRLKAGDRALVWRSSCCDHEELHGQEVIILERVKNDGGMYWVSMSDGGRIRRDTTRYYIVLYKDTEYSVSGKCLAKLPYKVELGSWDSLEDVCGWRIAHV